MKYAFTPELEKELKHLQDHQPKLLPRIKKQLRIFALNPLHPSLRTHKLKGRLADYWSISVAKDIRLLYYITEIKEEKVAVFFALGTHDQVYR